MASCGTGWLKNKAQVVWTVGWLFVGRNKKSHIDPESVDFP